jgi:hypothetical protein
MKSSVLITFIICGTAILFIPFLGALTRVDVGDDYRIGCFLLGTVVLIISMIGASAGSQSPQASARAVDAA